MIVMEHLKKLDGWMDLGSFIDTACRMKLCDRFVNLLKVLEWVLVEMIYVPHFEAKKIVHGDLRDVNILVNYHEISKCCDAEENCGLLTDKECLQNLVHQWKSIDYPKDFSSISEGELRAYSSYLQKFVASIRIIDLDWCGREGTVQYPFDLNEDLFNLVARDANCNKPKRNTLIEAAQDRAMIRYIFSKKSANVGTVW
jgi:hypothetical protein